MESKLRILHAVSDLRPQFCGVSRAVSDMTNSLAVNAHIECQVVTPRGVESRMGESDLSFTSAFPQHMSFGFGTRFRRDLFGFLSKNIPNVMHVHGLWIPATYWATRGAQRYQIPYLMQTHGMLESIALDNNRWKKKFAWSLYQRDALQRACVIVSTSEREAEGIRRLDLRNPIALIPNGIDVERIDILNQSKVPVDNKKIRTALFVGRIHPIKGLIDLVDAWAKLRPIGWRVVIAGPDENGHRAQVESRIRERGLIECFQFAGPVDDVEKAALYQTADIFVLPTLSENFGIVVAEALIHKLPVMTTKAAPWQSLETNSCGWWIDIGLEPLVNALSKALSCSPEKLAGMGERGHNLVKNTFSWSLIVDDLLEVYRWVVREGDKPSCII